MPLRNTFGAVVIDANAKLLHMRRVRAYFATLPQLRPETIDIVLRSHLDVPEELLPAARKEIVKLHRPDLHEERKSA